MSSLIEALNKRIDSIDPIAYGRYRNFVDGPVTQLSPYISRGVISTRYVLESLKAKGYKWNQLERLAQQLSWRDYFQRVYQHHHHLATQSVKNDPEHFISDDLPVAIAQGNTGIKAIDQGIETLLENGMMHNHMRMYVAMLTTNIAKTHWKSGADWMYYHLLDADIAANYLSWQWVCGAFSSKLYFANQENINKYTKSFQRNTYLDCEYEEFSDLKVPEIFEEREILVSGDENSGKSLYQLNQLKFEEINKGMDLNYWIQKLKNLTKKHVLPIYTIYNLDVQWYNSTDLPKVLFLDSDLLKKHPMSVKTLEFIVNLRSEFSNMVCFYGTWDELRNWLTNIHPDVQCVFKEHPTNMHYQGQMEERDWIAPQITKYFPSFFGYWKTYEKLKS